MRCRFLVGLIRRGDAGLGGRFAGCHVIGKLSLEMSGFGAV